MKGFLAETQKILADFLLAGSPLKSFERCRAQSCRRGGGLNQRRLLSISYCLAASVKPGFRSRESVSAARISTFFMVRPGKRTTSCVTAA